MKLSEWLNRVDKSRDQFAAEIGVDPVSVGRYVTGERRPRWDVIAKIHRATGGQVSANDFLEIKESPPRRPSSGRVAVA